MLPTLRYIHSHPELIPSYSYVTRLAEWSETYPQTLSQIDAAIASIVISGVAVYLWPDHFAGSDWDRYGVIKATALHTVSTAIPTWYLEMYNTSKNKNQYKKTKFETEIATLRKSYFEKKEQNIDKNSEKDLLTNALTNYEKFLFKTENNSDLYKATKLLNIKRRLGKEEKVKENKAIISAEIGNLYIKMLRDNPEKNEHFNIWASFSDLELAIKWYKKYRAPNIFRIFKSIYEARCKEPNYLSSTTYTLVSPTIPHETLEVNESNYKDTLYELVSDASCDSPDILIEKINAKKNKILESINSETLKKEAELKTKLLVAKIKAIGSNRDENLRKEVFKCKKSLAEDKKEQIHKIHKEFGDYSPRTKGDFRTTMWLGWSLTAAICYFNPENYIKLSTSNRVIVWLLNVSVQQARINFFF